MKKRNVSWILVSFSLLLFIHLFSEENILSEGFPEKNTIVYSGYSPSQEIIEARTLNSKVFRAEKGYLVHRIFTHPVHFVNDRGELENLSPDSLCCFDWNVTESYSGYVDGLFEEKNVCGQTATYIQVNDTWFYRGFVEFNTNSIPDTAVIDTVILNLYCVQWPIYNEDHDIWSMESQPSSAAALTVYDDAANGTCYVGNYLGNTGWNAWDLGVQGAQDLQNKLVDDWFAIGISGFESASAYYLLYQCGTGWLDVIEEVTAVDEHVQKPTDYSLSENYPNPFNSSTTIILTIPSEQVYKSSEGQEKINLLIYDISGRLVRSFVLPAPSSELHTNVLWDGTDHSGKVVPNGTYFYQIKVGTFVETKKMNVIR